MAEVDLTPKSAKIVINKEGNDNILVLGIPGSGKTAQFLSLPGKKFLYVFDPNSIQTIQGYDVDYLEFLPDDLGFNIRSLAKGKGDKRLVSTGQTGAYNAWEEHAENAIKGGFFDSYAVIGFDSSTTLLDLIMDRVLTINGRAGQWPQQDDYGPQMHAFTKIVRTFTSLNKIIYYTGHIEPHKDDISGRISHQPLMTGRLRTKIPLLFSSIFTALGDTERQSGKTTWSLQTRPTREFPLCRTSLRKASFMEDVTLDFSKPLETQGLGAILTRG